jgi:hypothetical protein
MKQLVLQAVVKLSAQVTGCVGLFQTVFTFFSFGKTPSIVSKAFSSLFSLMCSNRFFSWAELYKCAKFFDTLNGPFIGFAYYWYCC